MEYKVTINGKQSQIKKAVVSYADLVGMTTLKGKPTVSYTIHPRFNSGKKFLDSKMVQGDVIRAQDGMIFTIKN